MKKLKIISVVAVLALLTTTLCSCKKTDDTKVPQYENAKFEEVFVADYEEKATEVKSSRLAQYEGYRMSSVQTGGYSMNNDDMVKMFTKTLQAPSQSTGSMVTSRDYSLYNVVLDRQIASFRVEDTDTKSITAEYCRYSYYAYAIKVVETTTLTGVQVATYYSLDGKTLVKNSANATAKEVNYVSQESEDDDTYYVIEANDVNYKVNVKTGETESVEGNNVGNVITDYELTYDIEGEKYNYIYNQYGEIYTYDKEDKLVSYQNFENDGLDATIQLLANETFLIQSSTYCDPYSDDYDLLEASSYGTQKLKVKQYIYDPSTNDTTQINPGFVVTAVRNKLVNEEFNETYKDTVENVATISFIVDRKLVSRDRDVVLNNDLKVVGYIDNYVVNQTSAPSLYADNRFVVVSNNGGFYLNEKGEVIGKISSNATENSRFILTPTALYDRVTFAKLLDLSEQNLTYSNTVGSNYIFTKAETTSSGSSTSYYTYGKSGLKMLFNSENVYDYSFNSNYYYIIERKTGSSSLSSTYKYSYFNGEGELMFNYEDSSAYSSISPISIYKVQLFECITTDINGNNVYNYYRVA